MVCLNSKVYIAHGKATAGRKAFVKRASKGLQHSLNPIAVSDMRDVLDTKTHRAGINRGFRVMEGRTLQYSQSRAALTYFYAKRIVHEDGVSTSPLNLDN